MINLKNNIMKYLFKELFLFIIGGMVYLFIEILWRGHTHWSMGIVGGLCFVFMGLINEFLTYEMYIEVQSLISSIIITIIEFVSGVIINIILKWNVWDYSNLPFNIMGQVCLLYMILWFGLSFIGIYFDDIIRYKFFNEEKPKYKSFIFNKINKYLNK